MDQILIDCFGGHSLYPGGQETAEKPFVLFFCGGGGGGQVVYRPVYNLI